MIGQVIFHQICAPCPKVYHIQIVNHDGAPCQKNDVSRMKGIRKNAARQFSHQDYLDVILQGKKMYSTFHSIKNQDYVLTTEKVRKVALSSLDQKRYWLCEIHSLAFGSPLIPQDDECFFCEEYIQNRNKASKRKNKNSSISGIENKQLKVSNI